MKILFLGNSITRGQIGESFITSMQVDNPIWNIQNAGADGDTLKNISDRLVKILSDGSTYDFVVIEAGHNDIILPQFNKKGILFRYALRHLLRNGRQPLRIEDFKMEYVRMIKLLRAKTRANIILTTLSCINENLLSETNLIRIEYNKVIRNIARGMDCILADVSEEFETILKENKQTDYLLESFLLFNSTVSKKAELLEKPTFPDKDWLQYKTPEDAGWSASKLEKAKRHAEKAGSSCILIIYKGAIVQAWGDATRRFLLHSARKATLTALIGIYESKNKIDLSSTIGELGINEITLLQRSKSKRP